MSWRTDEQALAAAASDNRSKVVQYRHGTSTWTIKVNSGKKEEKTESYASQKPQMIHRMSMARHNRPVLRIRA